MKWEELIAEARGHFAKADPVLHRVMLEVELAKPDKEIKDRDYFEELVSSIINQQLSGKAADTIFSRFLACFPDGLAPGKVLLVPDDRLRAAGMSFAKIKYVKDLAERVVNNKLHLDKLTQMNNEEIMAELVAVKGIGSWTVEMFLIFTLQRPDVYSVGDLGLTKSVMKLYGFKEKPTKVELLRISGNWSPYRSIASRLLWRYLDIPNERTEGK
jgi:DNA-3-methyladenine glycosylase II